MALESPFQRDLIQEIKASYPGCIVMKQNANYRQGIPDILVLFENAWAALECKRGPHEAHQPNQDWYVDQMNNMSFAAFIFPENKEDVLVQLRKFFMTQ